MLSFLFFFLQLFPHCSALSKCPASSYLLAIPSSATVRVNIGVSFSDQQGIRLYNFLSDFSGSRRMFSEIFSSVTGHVDFELLSIIL